MVRHILFLACTTGVCARLEDAAAELQRSFDGMVGRIPGLLRAEVGINFAGGPYHLCLYCEFERPEDVEGYRSHPLHTAHNKAYGGWITGRACVDFIPPPEAGPAEILREIT